MKIADNVIIRGKPEFRFDVDGEDFPWYITQRGAHVTRLTDDLLKVHVQIMGISKSDSGYISVNLDYNGHLLTLGGVEFPWMIEESGIVITASCKDVLTIALSFFAHEVDSDEIICDARQIVDIDGNILAGNTDDNPWLDEPRSDDVPPDGNC